jgi:uncharacterized OsmC-like protein
MTMQDVAAAMQRAQGALQLRPQMGLHDDAPATARWQDGAQVVTQHANGTQVPTDIPAELGGHGEHVTPGWLFRAGLAACAATSIAMAAAEAGIELEALEVRASSRSDTRGALGMNDVEGQRVFAGPGDVQLHVRIRAHDASPERLHALAEEGCRRSPIPNAVQAAVPLALHIDVVAG